MKLYFFLGSVDYPEKDFSQRSMSSALSNAKHSGILKQGNYYAFTFISTLLPSQILIYNISTLLSSHVREF